MAGLHLTLSEGDIVAYVRNICSSFLMLSEKKHVHLTFFSAVEWLNMSFDEDKVGKIVMNLLSNAFKFTPNGGRVDVSLEVLKGSPETLEIKVSDTGIGVKDEDKERIFERFYQAEHEGEDNHSTGSGIGLSLVRDFVTLPWWCCACVRQCGFGQRICSGYSYQAFGGECCYAFVGRSGRRRCGCAGSDWGDKSGKGRIGRRKEEALGAYCG